MRTIVSYAWLLGLGLSFTVKAATPLQANRIVPGTSVGQVHIGENMEAVLSRLGKPDTGDAAMGHAWSVWISKSSKRSLAARKGSAKPLAALPHELDIYSVRDNWNEGKNSFVEQIRVTSPWFRAESGAAVGSRLSQLRRIFKDLHPAAHYDSQTLKRRVEVYDSVKRGIAFEVIGSGRDASKSRCIAVTIHRRGSKVTAIYMPLDPAEIPSPG